MGEVIKGRFPYVDQSSDVCDQSEGPIGELRILGDNTQEIQREKNVRGIGMDELEQLVEEGRRETKQQLIFFLGKMLHRKRIIGPNPILAPELDEREYLKAEEEKYRMLMSDEDLRLAEEVANHYPFAEQSNKPDGTAA
jgi:hypothetical protein